MSEDLKKFLYRQLSNVDGLYAIVVSDRDGVPVLKIANEKAPDYTLRPAFLGTFTLATDQASKLGYGRNKYIICSYSNYNIIKFNRQPLTVSFVTNSECNIGLILDLGEELQEYLGGVKQAVADLSKTFYNAN
uniref:ragulator complex protein LAMTOR3-A-like n=1 Tax=Styela clava TaxID=7725 RepID=UPI001939C17A|nr:ragulator complex protein LAMTOR3-A-like [Styela clava]